MMKALSSLTLTLYALGALVLCLAVGMILAQAPPYSQAMPAMDQGLILDWLLDQLAQGQGVSLLAVWFLALCCSVGLLVLNLCACTWTRLLPRLRNGSRLQNWLLLLAHVLMILILLGHLSQMTLGYKEEGVKLLAGAGHELPDGLRLRLDQVVFTGDPAQLNQTYRQARVVQTRQAFDLEKNQVRVSLWRAGRQVDSGRLRILEPLCAQGLRMTLSDFYRDDAGDQPRVGAVFTASHNPLTYVFFSAYLAWIAVYLLLAGRAFVRNGEQKKS